MGSIVSVLVVLFLLVIAICLAVAVSAALFATSLGLLYRGASPAAARASAGLQSGVRGPSLPRRDRSCAGHARWVHLDLPPQASARGSGECLSVESRRLRPLAVRAEPSAGANVCGDSTKPDQAINVCSFDGREFDHPGVCPATCIWHSWSFEPFDESKVMGPRK